MDATLWSHDITQPLSIGQPLALAFNLRHNDLSTATVTVSTADDRVERLTTPGGRLVLRDDLGRPLFCGEYTGEEGSRLKDDGAASGLATVTCTFTSDMRLFWAALAMPVPENLPVSTTSTAAASWISVYTLDQSKRERQQLTGPAETVLKTLFLNNMARLDPRLTVSRDLGRGDTITVSNRFDPFNERTLSAVSGAGLGVQVTQNDNTRQLVLDVYEPGTFRHDMSEEGGTVGDYSWTRKAPSVTRLYVGGQGEGKARQVIVLEDTRGIERWGILEGWYDATSASTTDELVREGSAQLYTLTATTSISAALTGGNLQLIDDLWLGDQVTIEVGDGVEFTDQLTGIDITLAKGVDGMGERTWEITPLVGDVTGHGNQLINTVRRLARVVNMKGRA